MKNNSVIKPITAFITAALFIAFCLDLSVWSVGDASYLFLIICTLAVVVAFRKNLPSSAVFYTMLAGMFLKLTYVIYTPVWCRQHDVIDFGAGEGHAAYMEYILSHKALPDFDPREVWAFFQPPLHHAVSAVWMWLGIRMHLSEEHIHKNVQILPLMYMCLLMFVVYLICRELNMRRGGMFVTMLIVSFNPIYILMSGSINNDALSILLTVTALYFSIRWYMEPTNVRILLLALSIGLAMSAKLSSALVAIPIGIMMIYKIWTDTGHLKDRPKFISYCLELVPFAVVVFPLGLWWSIRNKILFDMPPGYIPEVGEQVSTGFVSSILDVRTASPFLYMKSNGFSYDEYNLILAMLKSSLFGEGDFAKGPMAVTAAGWVLFFGAIIVTAFELAGAIRICSDKKAGPDAGIKILLSVTAVSYVCGYAVFALKGANLSAMDFRYSAAAVSALALFAGFWYDRLSVRDKKPLYTAVMSSSILFAAASALFYILVGVFAL